jgi:tRNA G10  N-methylase Trm11
MATPAISSQSHFQSRTRFSSGRQLDLLPLIWNIPQNEREESGTFALSFSPQLVRYLVHHYSAPGETVLDPFVGHGTTVFESLLMGRKPIGVDCNDSMIESIREQLHAQASFGVQLYTGDARRMTDLLADDSVDLIVTQPPYGSTHPFSRDNRSDLSLLTSSDFLTAIEAVAAELYRVLKPDGVCALLIGDVRDRGRMMPLGFQFVHRFLSRGFSVKEIYDSRTPTSHLPISLHAHEYLLILYKKPKAPKRPR